MKIKILSLTSNITLPLLAIILLASFLIRVINLNYSSPFNDEAIYIVLGRLGIFQWDWWSYNASAWMAGLPFMYPTMTAIAYMSGGILGSRLLNVVFGVLAVEAVFIITRSLSQKKDGYENIAGLVGAAVLGGASVSLYVSRLATLDMPSFSFFLLGLALLLYAIEHSKNTGKWYFLSALLLYVSFLTKIIVAIYIPLIIAYSFFFSRREGQENYSFWKRYFFLPLLSGLVFFFIGNFAYLKTYAVVQSGREKDTILTIVKIIWENSSFVWIFYLVGSLGMLLVKDWRRWLTLSLAVFWILLSHIISERRFTLEKHVFLAVVFMSVIGGLGISEFLRKTRFKVVKVLLLLFLIAFLSWYWIVSYQNAHKYNQMWQDATEMLQELPKFVNSGDKVLAEVGAPAILATYEKNYPTNTITFDWFEYQKLQGEKAYVAALKDGYFDLVEVDGEDSPKDPINKKMHNIIKKYLNTHYDMVYGKNGFQLYKKIF